MKDTRNPAFTRVLSTSSATDVPARSLTRQGELGLLSLLKRPDLVRGDVLAGFGDLEELSMTIERFREIRAREAALELATAIVASGRGP